MGFFGQFNAWLISLLANYIGDEHRADRRERSSPSR